MKRTVIPLLLFWPAALFAGDDLLSDRLAGMSACGATESFAGKKLFDYMDGGAELYLAYGFSRVAVRTYQQEGNKVTIEVYRLASEDDAFGIFSHGRGEAVEAGARALLSAGLLSFHKGIFFVRLVAATSPPLGREKLLELARELAAKIPGESRLPEAARLLPANHLEGSLRYLAAPDSARTVWLEGEGDILLTDGGRAFTASYDGRDGELQASLISYPDPAAAERACRALAEKLSLKPAAQGDCAAAGRAPDQTFSALARQGSVLRWAAGAYSREEAEGLLAKIK